MRHGLVLLFFLFSIKVLASPGGQSDRLKDEVSLNLEVASGYYQKGLGSFKKSGWWNDANNLETILNASRYVDVHDFDWMVLNSYPLRKWRPYFNYINDIYDDESWWGITWIKAYESFGDEKFLETAKNIHHQIQEGAWSAQCGGGVHWKKHMFYKNATTNGVVLEFSLYLAEITRAQGEFAESEAYLSWSKSIVNWFLSSGMLDKKTGLIADGIFEDDCQSNHQLDWTYNQGLYIGASALLYRLTGEIRWLDLGKTLIRASWEYETRNQTLFERNCHDSNLQTPWKPWIHGFVGEPSCAPDSVTFKGIYMKNLALFDETLPESDSFKIDIEKFVRIQIAAVEKSNEMPGLIGLNWGEVSVIHSVASHFSGLEALISGYRILHSSGVRK